MLGENTWQRLDRAARHSTPGIVTVALVGIVLSTGVTWLGRKLTPWAPRGSRPTEAG